ncbi:MAG: hypothetical protein J5I81_02860 [Nitrococcus mobilis]|nr:hypothetical protein [Nitrococcus mobilis]
MRLVSALGIQDERNPKRFVRHSVLGVGLLAAYVLAAHLGLLLLAAEFAGLITGHSWTLGFSSSASALTAAVPR